MIRGILAMGAMLLAATTVSASPSSQTQSATIAQGSRTGGSTHPMAQMPRAPYGVQGPINRAAGFYLIEGHVDLKNWREIYHAGISHPYIHGAAIMLNWKSIEPTPNGYDWTALDLQLADVLREHKVFTIGLIAGSQAPNWIYDTAGVPALRDIVLNATQHTTGPLGCQKVNQPLVWDDRYLHEYAAVMTALANHLKRIALPTDQNGTAFDALVGVKLSGINLTTEELRIDAHVATPGFAACPEPDVTALWMARGYRPSLIVKAWVEIARVTASLYPGKLLNVDVIPNAAFPNIDDKGARTPPPNVPGRRHVVEPVNARILDYGVRTYGNRLLVQWDALSQDGILPIEVTDSGRRGASMGYQMNGFGGGNFGGSGCIYNPGFKVMPCRSANDFGQALHDGIRSGARYIEVQPTNVAVKYLRPANPAIPSFNPALEKAASDLVQY